MSDFLEIKQGDMSLVLHGSVISLSQSRGDERFPHLRDVLSLDLDEVDVMQMVQKLSERVRPLLEWSSYLLNDIAPSTTLICLPKEPSVPGNRNWVHGGVDILRPGYRLVIDNALVSAETVTIVSVLTESEIVRIGKGKHEGVLVEVERDPDSACAHLAAAYVNMRWG